MIFSFRNPLEGKTEKEKEQLFSQFAGKGINGVNIRQSGDDKYTELRVFPYAIVHYKGKDMPVRLLESHLGYTPPGDTQLFRITAGV